MNNAISTPSAPGDKMCDAEKTLCTGLEERVLPRLYLSTSRPRLPLAARLEKIWDVPKKRLAEMGVSKRLP